MKIITAILLLSFTLLVTPAAVNAADEFGANFTSDAPTALQDTEADYTTEAISKIEPAAGDNLFQLEGQQVESLEGEAPVGAPQTEELLDVPADGVIPGRIQP